MAEKIEATFGMFSGSASLRGRTVPMMLAALSTYHAGMSQVVVVGDPTATETQALMRVVRRRYIPGAVVVPIYEAYRQELSRLLPWTEELRMRDGRATAYVCQDFTCQTPVTAPQDLAQQLARL
jgi:uncharacterized protein YyaL (SSP411 family)